jgi:hypothetical protein
MSKAARVTTLWGVSCPASQVMRSCTITLSFPLPPSMITGLRGVPTTVTLSSPSPPSMTSGKGAMG